MRKALLLTLGTAFLLAACRGQENPAISTPASTSLPTTTSPSASPSVPPNCIDQSQTEFVPFGLSLKDFFFAPPCLIVRNTQNVTLKNEGTTLHNWSIEGTQVDIDVEPGQVQNLEAIGGALAPGTYEFFCKYHRARGMRGTIVVKGPEA